MKNFLTKHKKYIIGIIIFLATMGVVTTEQKDSILRVVESFTSTGVTE